MNLILRLGFFWLLGAVETQNKSTKPVGPKEVKGERKGIQIAEDAQCGCPGKPRRSRSRRYYMPPPMPYYPYPMPYPMPPPCPYPPALPPPCSAPPQNPGGCRPPFPPPEPTPPCAQRRIRRRRHCSSSSSSSSSSCPIINGGCCPMPPKPPCACPRQMCPGPKPSPCSPCQRPPPIVEIYTPPPPLQPCMPQYQFMSPQPQPQQIVQPVVQPVLVAKPVGTVRDRRHRQRRHRRGKKARRPRHRKPRHRKSNSSCAIPLITEPLCSFSNDWSSSRKCSSSSSSSSSCYRIPEICSMSSSSCRPPCPPPGCCPQPPGCCSPPPRNCYIPPGCCPSPPSCPPRPAGCVPNIPCSSSSSSSSSSSDSWYSYYVPFPCNGTVVVHDPYSSSSSCGCKRSYSQSWRRRAHGFRCSVDPCPLPPPCCNKQTAIKSAMSVNDYFIQLTNADMESAALLLTSPMATFSVVVPDDSGTCTVVSGLLQDNMDYFGGGTIMTDFFQSAYYSCDGSVTIKLVEIANYTDHTISAVSWTRTFSRIPNSDCDYRLVAMNGISLQCPAV